MFKVADPPEPRPSTFQIPSINLKQKKKINMFKRKIWPTLFLAIPLAVAPGFCRAAAKNTTTEKPIYKNPKAPVEKRVEDLLSRMTTEEKVAQLGMLFISTNNNASIAKLVKQGLGNVHDMIQLRRWTAEKASEELNKIQKVAVEESRLGIPVIISNEALHGLISKNAVSYPQAIALAAMFDPERVEEIADAIGVECRARGDRQVLSPVVNMARDPRWGRVEETYGEDPLLTAKTGAAFCRGLANRGIIATPKHFVANFGDGGRDSNAVNLSKFALWETYFPGFQACIREGGAMSIMSSYNTLDGIPCTANHWLLTDVLRKKFGFTGFVISDAWAVQMLISKHHVTGNKIQAAALALNAGVDVELSQRGPYIDGSLLKAVKSGLIPQENLDNAVRRVLRVKFRIGLFEEPYANPKSPEYVGAKKRWNALSLKAAEKSIVLLKNDKHTLPFGANVKTLAIIGPLATNAKLGGYSKYKESPMSLDAGLKLLCKEDLKIINEKSLDISKAVAAAKNADAAVMVMGISENEGKDRCRLGLSPEKESLIKAVAATGKPTVVILYAGNAVTMSNWIDSAGAVLDAWYPGDLGGLAIAEILFGKVNPSGKLPITFPRLGGQVPLCYNYKTSGRGYNYEDAPGTPLFPFGHGLSYTTYKYEKLAFQPQKVPFGENVTVSMDILNSGQRAGDEVVQLYINDPVASMTQPLKRLAAFKRISLKPGEKKHVSFTLTPRDLSFLDQSLEWQLEPGAFKVMIGTSSGDIRLKGQFHVLGKH